VKSFPLLVVVCVLLAGGVRAQDVSRWQSACAKPRARGAEAIICADVELQALDDTLEVFYRAALAQSKEAAALRAGERRWLAEVRDRCGAKECVADAYRRRILELQEDILASTTPVAAPMDAKSAEETCRSVAALAGEGKLHDRFLPALPVGILQAERPAQAAIGGTPFAQLAAEIQAKTFGQPDTVVISVRVSAGRPPVAFGSVFTGGSCASAEVWNLEYLQAAFARGEKHPSTFAAPEDPKDELRWSWWGANDRAAFVGGRPLVVTVDGANPELVNLVSWIRPDGRVQPLCGTSYDTYRVLDAAHSPDAHCGSVEGAIEQGPDWEALDPAQVEVRPREGDPDYDGIDATDWDLDGDGRPEVLARLHVDSGAGCGSHREWLRVLDAKRAATVDGPLDRALGDLQAEKISVLRLEGTSYVDAYYSKSGGTTYRMRGVKPVPACRFTILPFTRIDRMWIR